MCYSDKLADIISSMLNLKPENRPSAWEIAREIEMLGKVGLAAIPQPQTDKALLGTIELPQNLNRIYARLPKSNYDQRQHRSEDRRIMHRQGMGPEPYSYEDHRQNQSVDYQHRGLLPQLRQGSGLLLSQKASTSK